MVGEIVIILLVHGRAKVRPKEDKPKEENEEII
jgi:hypothetical protein